MVKQYQANNIPLEAIWSDLDYMDSYRDFTIDQENYGDLQEFQKELHD